jgi:hypothetical protein
MIQTTDLSPEHQHQRSRESAPFTIALVIKITVALAVVLAILMFFLSRDPKTMITGLAFGTIFSILNFRLLHLTIERSLNMPPGRAKAYVSSRYMIRYVLTGAVLFTAISNERFNILGAVLGLVIIKGVIFALNARDAVKKKQKV